MMHFKAREKPQFKIRYGGRELDTDLYYMAKLFKKVALGYSPIIGICGKQRIGKSTVGIWICYMYMLMMGKLYDPCKHTFYDPLKAISNLEQQDRIPLMIDEAGGLLHRREYFDKMHQSLNKIIQTQGYKSLLYIFISPFIDDIDKSFTKHFDFILRVDDRGKYKAFEVIKKYDQIDNTKAVKKRFLDDVRLNLRDLPEGVWEKYLNYSIEQKELMRKNIENDQRVRMSTKEYNMDPLARIKKGLR